MSDECSETQEETELKEDLKEITDEAVRKEDKEELEELEESEEEPTREELKEEVEELETSLKKVMADFDNYKKRMIKEKNRIRQLANKSLVVDLLEVLDDLERALDNEEDIDRDGIEMIFEKFMRTLEDHGLEKIDAEGEQFDPMYHDCVQSEERDDVEEDKIIEVYQEGYKLNDEVIRPSKVKVSK
ncbi:MAG: nucleotide exchange factor GrpE [Candidatus Thermoplasmatota archaeon]|nr:nucleotide exchange factor GrpE [Candidatus Thermoplasmatota archaeon]